MSAENVGRKVIDLRVCDLKEELEKRKLDVTGNKPALLERLKKAIQDEGHDPETFTFATLEKREGIKKSNSSRKSVDVEASDEQAEMLVDEVGTIDNEEFNENVESHNNGEQNDSNMNDNEESINLTIEEDEQKLLHAQAQDEKDNIKVEDKTDEDVAEDVQEEEEEEDAKGKGQTSSSSLSSKLNEDVKIKQEKNDEKDNNNKSSATGSSGGNGDGNDNNVEDGKKVKEDSEQKSSSKSTAVKDEKDKSTVASKSKSSSSRNLWVSGLSSITRASDLKTIFSKYGKVIGAKVVTNTRTPGTRCYGYVTMGSSADATKCIEHLHRTELHGRIISVERTKNEIGGSSSTIVKKEEKKPDTKEQIKSEDKDNKAKPKEKEKEPEKDKEKEKRTENESKKTNNDGSRRSIEKAKSLAKSETSSRHTSRKSRSSERRRSSVKTTDRDRIRSIERERERERERLRHREREREREREILSFQKIREERERQRIREREIRRREIRRRQREEEQRLAREREELALERERLEREKAELLRLERERQKLEREKIELERLELKRQQMKLMQQTQISPRIEDPPKRTLKRTSTDRYADSERKRPTSDRRFEAPPPPKFDSSITRSTEKRRDEYNSGTSTSSKRDDYSTTSKRDEYKREVEVPPARHTSSYHTTHSRSDTSTHKSRYPEPETRPPSFRREEVRDPRGSAAKRYEVPSYTERQTSGSGSGNSSQWHSSSHSSGPSAIKSFANNAMATSGNTPNWQTKSEESWRPVESPQDRYERTYNERSTPYMEPSRQTMYVSRPQDRYGAPISSRYENGKY